MLLRVLLVGVAALAAVGHGPNHGSDAPEGGPLRCVNAAAEYAAFCSKTDQPVTKYFVCSSVDAQRVQCLAPISSYQKAQAVALATAHTECREGTSFGLTDEGAWVAGGCVATFTAEVTPDGARCERARNVAQDPKCAPVAKDIEVCQADIAAFCGDLTREEEWAPGRQGGDWHRGHHGFGRHEHRPHHELPFPISPAAARISQCLRDHAASLGPECRGTTLFQVVSHLDPEYLNTVILMVAGVVVAVVLATGLGYFAWKRQQWARRRPVPEPKAGRWSTGLFALDWASCLPSCLCPMFQSALLQAEVHDRDSSLADVVMHLSNHSVVTNTYYTRQALRAKYDIPEAPVTDCFASMFCLPCVIAQHTREVESRHNGPERLIDDAVLGQVVQKGAADDMMI